MSSPDPLSEWSRIVSTAFPHLSRPQARVLALWSYGMVLARTCGITQVAAALALHVGGKEASLVQRWREWCYGAADPTGFQAARSGCEHLLRAVAPLDRPPLAQRAAQASAGLGRDHIEETLYGAGVVRPLSRLCHPGGLEDRRRRSQRLLASAWGWAAPSGARQHPSRLHGAGVYGSGLVCPLAL